MKHLIKESNQKIPCFGESARFGSREVVPESFKFQKLGPLTLVSLHLRQCAQYSKLGSATKSYRKDSMRLRSRIAQLFHLFLLILVRSLENTGLRP